MALTAPGPGLFGSLGAAQGMLQAAGAWGHQLLDHLPPLQWPALALAAPERTTGTQEMEIMESLQSGRFVEDHLEGSYFKAMQTVLKVRGVH